MLQLQILASKLFEGILTTDQFQRLALGVLSRIDDDNDIMMLGLLLASVKVEDKYATN